MAHSRTVMPADGCAEDEFEARDAEVVDELDLGVDDVADADEGEVGP